jgi:hypothetical protein
MLQAVRANSAVLLLILQPRQVPLRAALSSG